MCEVEQRLSFANVADVDAQTAIASGLLAKDGLVAELIAAPLAELRANPWFEPPFRFSRDALRTGMVLLDLPAASLSITITSADMLASVAPAKTVTLPGRMAVVRYLRGGGAQMDLWRADVAGPDFSSAHAAPCRRHARVRLDDGAVMQLDGRSEGHVTHAGHADIVAVIVTLKGGASPFAREYSIADGTLVRVGTLDEGGARAQMMLALLRLDGRGDASAAFDHASRDPAFFVRWSAMREWLALDVRAALPRLVEMAATDANAEVRAAAARMVPVASARIAEREATLCPA